MATSTASNTTPTPSKAMPRVCVFAPSPMLTVTIEPLGDEAAVHIHAGGQGPWVANMLGVLGTRVLLCGPFGGETGQVLQTLLDRDSLELHRVETSGSNGCYVQDRRGGERARVAWMPPAVLSRHEVDDLYGQTMVAGLASELAVLCGAACPNAVPADFFGRLAADLTTLGVPVVADLVGEPLAAALEGGLAVAKVSHEELVADGRAASDSVADLVNAMGPISRQVSRAVIVSRAEAPALALVDNEILEVAVPSLRRVEHRGAGDSMTAGVAAALAHGADLLTALRLGAAAGTANVTRHGLASGQWETIQAIAKKVEVRPLNLRTGESAERPGGAGRLEAGGSTGDMTEGTGKGRQRGQT